MAENNQDMKHLLSANYTLTELDGKKPIKKNWPKEVFNPMFSTKGNYGVVLQDEDFIIDYDPRNDKNQGTPNNSLKRLINDFNLPKTFIVKTGGGGVHLYFKKPKHLLIRSRDNNYPGIDFLSKGKQVVGPGSVHPITKELYSILGEKIHASFIPNKILVFLGKSQFIHEGTKSILSDSSTNKIRYINYLKTCAPAIEGQNGDQWTLEVAQKGLKFGLLEETTFQLMSECFNPRCEPAWDDEELRRKVYNAYKYSNNISPGCFNAESQFDKIEQKSDKLKSVIKSISDINDAKDYDWIVQDYFARGFISIIFGEPGCGKTWLILVLCLGLSNGSTIWNGMEVNKTKVLLLEGDSTDALLKNRIRKLNQKLNDEYFYYVNRYTAENNGINLSLSDEIGRANLEKIINENRPDFLVIDTLISFINDEKDAEGIKKVIDHLRIIAERYNLHVLICHHSRKRMTGEKRTKMDQSDVIGSSIITRLASVVIGVEKNE